MEKRKNNYWQIAKSLLLGTLFIIVTVGVWAYIEFHSGQDPFFPKSKIKVIFLKNINIKLYIKTITWGLSGNHQEIFITQSNNSIYPDSLSDIVFDSDVVYYKVLNDSLLIVVSPKQPFGNILKHKYVNIVSVNNGDSIDNLKNNFHNYELIRVSVYD